MNFSESRPIPDGVWNYLRVHRPCVAKALLRRQITTMKVAESNHRSLLHFPDVELTDREAAAFDRQISLPANAAFCIIDASIDNVPTIPPAVPIPAFELDIMVGNTLLLHEAGGPTPVIVIDRKAYIVELERVNDQSKVIIDVDDAVAFCRLSIACNTAQE